MDEKLIGEVEGQGKEYPLSWKAENTEWQEKSPHECEWIERALAHCGGEVHMF